MKIAKSLLATVLGLVAWFVVLILGSAIVDLLGRIPIIGAFLYYPADASWAQVVLPTTAAVATGAFCSIKIGGRSKLFSVLIAILYLADIILMFAVHNFSWSELLRGAISIATAAIFFPMSKNDI